MAAASDRVGHFEMLVMLAVMRLQAKAYGVMVARELTKRLRKRVALASVYAALERLEAKSWVRRKLGESTPVRGGKAKAYFTATPKGVHAVRENRRTLMSFWDGIATLK